MKIIKLKDCYKGQNANNCVYNEYDFLDNDIDFSTSKIVGNYPNNAYCINEECKEIIFVIKGNGTLKFSNLEIEFNEGDSILIDKNEKYQWLNCNCTIAMCCTPAWNAKQHKIIKI